MYHPFQCIATVEAQGDGSPSFLLAACGPQLKVVSLSEGRVVSEWSSANEATNTAADDGGPNERPAKKQKLLSKPVQAPKVIKLVIAPDQRHAIAITEDKCLRVFGLDAGRLTELSQRMMPKRPCAVHILPDIATIICGDKFGDVYSLPLLPGPDKDENADTEVPNDAEPVVEKAAFKPSATNLTVHTKRNRKALEAQMQQKNFTTRKEPLKFEHKLVLGHVSMLTDVLHATHTVDGKDRNYIITADRDEHIRVSRGPPQSHIIEGYCLGHKEFVSKLCLIPGTDLMVSGGGENWLGVWEWPTCTLRRKIALYDDSTLLRVPTVGKIYRANLEAEATAERTTLPAGEVSALSKKSEVSGLWTVPYLTDNGKKETALIIAMERCAGLYIVPVNQLHTKTAEVFGLTSLKLEHPLLDVACSGDTMIVSLDARDDGQARFWAYKLRHKEGHQEPWHVACERDEEMERKLSCITTDAGNNGANDGLALDGFLYSVANLRKRRNWNATATGDGDEGAEAVGDGVEED